MTNAIIREAQVAEISSIVSGALDLAIKREVRKLVERRAVEVQRLLIEELRTARINPQDVEKQEGIVAMCVATYTAMVQGAAFRNLRLIAKVLAHKAADPDDRGDDFLAWVDAIASLSQVEAIFLATLHDMSEEVLKLKEPPDKQHAVMIGETKRKLVGATKIIKSEVEFQALCSALTRTGFVILVSGYGSLTVAPAPRLSALARMANLQEWADSQDR